MLTSGGQLEVGAATGRTTGSRYCDATRVTSTAPPQGHSPGTGAAWVSSTRAGRGRQPWRPYSAPARRRRLPRPCGRSLANGAAWRRPARRASSNCCFRSSICCFRRSFSRCRRLFLRATGSSRAAGSRRRAPAASTLREAVRGRWTVPQSDAGAISGRRSSHHRYATTRKIVQVKKLTPGPEPANRRLRGRSLCGRVRSWVGGQGRSRCGGGSGQTLRS